MMKGGEKIMMEGGAWRRVNLGGGWRVNHVGGWSIPVGETTGRKMLTKCHLVLTLHEPQGSWSSWKRPSGSEMLTDGQMVMTLKEFPHEMFHKSLLPRF